MEERPRERRWISEGRGGNNSIDLKLFQGESWEGQLGDVEENAVHCERLEICFSNKFRASADRTTEIARFHIPLRFGKVGTPKSN